MDNFQNRIDCAAVTLLNGAADNGDIFGSGNSFEEEFGNYVNNAPNAGADLSPIAVRFQGVRLQADADLCDLDLEGVAVAPESVTPWVNHPAELDTFEIKPNALRFCIVFDYRAAPAALQVKGITNFRIKASPN